MVTEPELISPEDYWHMLAQRTRLEPVGLLVLVAILLERAKNGNMSNVTFNGSAAFMRLAQQTCPWLSEVRKHIPAPEVRIDVNLPAELAETPSQLASAFLDVFERDIVRRASLREEFVDALTDWLERERLPNSTWIVGEERALVTSFRRALSGRLTHFATSRGVLALAFLALRAYALNVEVEQLRTGVLDFRELKGPLLVIPEPNFVTGRAPTGFFQQNEFNYANSALYGEDRVIALVSGGTMFRTQGEDAEIKERFLRSERLKTVLFFPQATAVTSGSETVGAFLCEVKPEKKEEKRDQGSAESRSKAKKSAFETIFLVSFPRLFNTRLGWPKQLVAGLKKVLKTGRPVAGFECVEEKIETLIHDRRILTTNTRLYDPNEETLDRLMEVRGARSLETFVEVIRCHAIGKNVEAVVEDEASIVREVIPNDIDEWGILRHPEKQILRTRSSMQMKRIARQSLHPGDILFTQRGRIGAISLVTEIPEGECWIAGQLFLLLRMRDTSPVKDPVYLLRFLQSAPVRQHLMRMATNTSVQQIRAGDIENLLVPLPNKAEGIARAKASYSAILETAEKIKALQAEAQRLIGAIDV